MKKWIPLLLALCSVALPLHEAFARGGRRGGGGGGRVGGGSGRSGYSNAGRKSKSKKNESRMRERTRAENRDALLCEASKDRT